ncbi:hypothetical protein BaRGS_00002356 [Batillaria attramentaria]|uniref:Uncharacterized protein n=1 Tax=Batillaria attramentaria TaxID=370345 RepID=A0ABD0M4E7_9CAEN
MGEMSKDELREEVKQVTLELRQLQEKMEDPEFQREFRRLETGRQEVRRTYFPPKYFHMKDLAREYSRVATGLRNVTSTGRELEGLRGMQLREELRKRSSELERRKELVEQMSQLYPDSRGTLPWTRYRRLYRGVKYTMRSFNELMTSRKQRD